MKRNVILVLIIAGFAFGANAQERFLFGVKGGYTSTRFDLSNYDQRLIKIDDRDSQSGYLAGIYTRIRVFRGLSFQPEFYYAKKKGKLSFSGVNTDITFPDTSVVTNVEAWELPMLAHLKLIDFKAGNIFVVAGPIISFIKDGSTSPDAGFDFKKSNLTMMLGGGLEVWRVALDARYEWALSNTAVNKKGTEEFYHMFTISLGFKVFGI